MNQATKPVVYTLFLYLLSGVLVLTGCSTQQAKPSRETNTATIDPVADSVDSTAIAAAPTSEPGAIPFEEVLKRDREEAERKKKAKKTVLPTGDDAPKHKPSTPLRPPKATPVIEPEPVKPIPEPETVKPEQAETVTQEDTLVAPEPAAEIPATILFTLDQLPLTIADTWILAGDQDACSLQTVPVTMDDGAGETTVSLKLSKTEWLVDTKSDIDPSYSGTGLFFSNGVHIPLESIVKATKISISKQKQQLTDALKHSESVRVALGFWPTWPVSETQSKTISVAHFQQALNAWETCNQRITAR